MNTDSLTEPPEGATENRGKQAIEPRERKLLERFDKLLRTNYRQAVRAPLQCQHLMSDVFISYAHEDRPAAKTFADLLTRRGHTVFWDRQIAPGTTWDETIERELTQARCVVVLWSKHSVSSKWVKTEAGEAAERSVLLPVLIEETELPLRFKSLQTASLIHWDENEEDAELQNLLQAVKKLTDLNVSGGTARPSPPTPARQSRTRRNRRWLGGLLIALIIMGSGLYGTYQIAVRKRSSTTNLSYFTMLSSAEGLAVGDPVTVAGIPVGEIVKIDLMPPDDFFDIGVMFSISERYHGLVWTDSRAVVRWNPSKLKRLIEVSKGGTSGSTNELHATYREELVGGKRAITGVWDDKLGRYVPIEQRRWGYYLPAEEAASPGP